MIRLLARLTPVLLVALLGATGCSRPELVLGDGCNLNSDCPDPLACRLDRCRRQCVDSRDCGAGLACLLEPGQSSGGCQLPDEKECTLSSECGVRLVCKFGTCTTECLEDRDCANGQTCTAEEGVLACLETNLESCIYNSDCMAPLVCFPDQTCNFECEEDRDCTNPRVCVAHLCELP